MEVKQVAALPKGLEITDIEMLNDVLTITAVSICPHPLCPLCGKPSTRVHSHYMRQVADLPCGGQQVRLLVRVRKCFCDAPNCARKIFVERLTPFIDTFARVTRRLYQIVQIIGLATGGRLGVRVTDRLEIQTSRHTILRRIMALPTEPVAKVSQIGIDDFSFRRGRKFGTIVVDLQTHKVLDVLPDRTADTSAAWMAAHPEIELVSRDRGGDYAAAARKAVPEATQTADRFHLLKNLGEALEGVLSHHLAAHRRSQTEEVRATSLSTAQPVQPPKLSPKEAALSQAKREERLSKYEQVVALRKQGFSQTAIAEQVGVGHATVSRWLSSDTFPEQKLRQRMTRLAPHLKEVAERWEAGCHNIAQLHRELVAAGHTLTYKSVYKQLVRYLPEGRKNAAAPDQLPRPPVLARQAMFLFLRRPEELEADEQETLALLQSLHAEVKLAYELIQQFAQMLRTRTGEQLDDWLERVRASKIRQLQSFVTGVERDKAAVVAGLTLPQNNGLVEGKVNKLKLIKRMGYGRAGFPLLRQRILHAL
ncbi:ISL3 family transposase [Ktedonobacter racemifer]|uniref:Transposase IS204/IS1001/IS1096/IS1165 family protein n=1 Tax=Ktedonobacter racemifer DSM 44963 TaxID=485913 RepID=D6U3Y6_KTERA|nr:ISL3 family transposase [Ktedonobacter racemifer]EFH81224.1 transposase IS204/IS1001/IS1096/IS1165 family protein [Ktedonobacter racemifer DSM 44963]